LARIPSRLDHQAAGTRGRLQRKIYVTADFSFAQAMTDWCSAGRNVHS